ncbi:MAG: hypothetical protein U0746_04985 [Gemmataceae bacterium]
MLDRLICSAVSLTLAVLVWLYARHREQQALDNVPIPVHVRLAERDAAAYLLEVNGPSQVAASFTGPPSRMRELRVLLQRGELNVTTTIGLPTDLPSETRVLDTVRISASDLHPPPGVRAVLLEGQNRIPVTLRKVVERRLPVRLDHALHERLAQCQIEPSHVVVRGPQDILDRQESIATRPFTPPASAPGSPLQEVVVRGTAMLANEIDGKPVVANPATVAIKLTLRPARKLYEVHVPVHFLCPSNASFRPQWVRSDEKANRVALKLVGPPVAEVPSLAAYVDLTRPAFQAERDVTQALYSDEPIRVQLPADFSLAQEPPPAAPFLLVPLAPEPGRLPLFGGIPTP